MATCLINPNTNTNSVLYTELYEYFKGDEDKATLYYGIVLSNEFKQSFGDWELSYKDEKNLLIDRVIPESGEPKLFENKYGIKYFKLQDNKKYFLDRTLLNYNGIQRNALITNGIKFLFDGDVTSKKDIVNINLQSLFNPTREVEGRTIVNIPYVVLNGNKEDIKDLIELIQSRLNLLNKRIEDNEDFLEETENIDNTENTRNLDLRSAEEKNSKDNASSNIKFLLSFIPKFEGDELYEVPFTLQNGKIINLPTYNDYNEIWDFFESTLANIYPYNNGSSTINLFNKMVEEMKNKYVLKEINGQSNPNYKKEIDYILNNLINDDLPDFKKNQFVHAFLKSKVNFYTFTINYENNDVNIKVFDSGEVTSRRNKILKEYLSNFSRSKLFNNNEKTVNTKLAKEINDKFQKIRKNFIDNVTSVNLNNDKFQKIIKDLQDVFSTINIKIEDSTLIGYINTFDGENLFENTDLALDSLKHIFNNIGKLTNESIFNKDKFINPLNNETTELKKLAEQASFLKVNISENTVLGPNNKKYWTYSLPSYLNIKLDRLQKEIDEVQNINEGNEEISKSQFYKNSLFLNNFEKLKNLKLLTFNNLKVELSNDPGVDNKSITMKDQISEMLNKAVLVKGNEYKYNLFNTLAPADKGKSLVLQSEHFINTNIQKDGDNYTFSNDLVDIYKNYFLDEYNRIREVYELVDKYNNSTEEEKFLIGDDFYQYYHLKKGELTQSYGDYNIPSGNGFKFTLFDELNYDKYTPQEFIEINNTMGSLFDLSDEGNFYPALTDEEILNNPMITKLVNKKLNELFKSSLEELTELNIIIDGKANNFIDSKIFTTYLAEANGSIEYATERFLSDSIFNQHIMNIEYSKLFTGDYAFYKNLEDYSKRIPATYTDGIMLNLSKDDPSTYKMGVINDVIVNTNLYDDIDATDAQGWITLDRWEFLMKRLNKWSPKHDEALERIKSGNEIESDYKLYAQPLKGVYFDIIDGKPTYVKYSQAVLTDRNVKGKSIENMYNAMVSQGIDEVVALSGVKVGSIETTKIDDNGTILKDINFNFQELNNHSWKLQQDLTPKGIKATLLGSQMQKNIIRDIKLDADYNGETGKNRITNINTIISRLSNIGLENLQKELDLNINTGEIKNRENFYRVLIDEINRNDSEENVIEALKKEYDLNTIITNRSKFQSLIASIINNRTVKLKTNGASMIQMSSFGWDITDAKTNNVKMLVDENQLKAPRIKNNKVLPGQVFITHSELLKLVPNYQELSNEELRELLDPNILKIVGYRIPNQDLASNDALQIIGILPPGMGDTIIPYVDITTKTGSDFDIDKMYVFMPHIELKDGKVQLYSNKGTNSTQKELENSLLKEYYEILTSNENFDNLTNALDNPILKDLIVDLHSLDNNINGFDFFSPLFQVKKKFDNFAGKSGVGILANHGVHHTFAQLADLQLNVDLGIFDNNNKQNKEKDELQKIIQGSKRKGVKNNIETVQRILKRRKETSDFSGEPELIKFEEVEILRSIATVNDLWYIKELHESEEIGNGAEQSVYLRNNKVIKLNDGFFYNSWEDYFNNLKLHNYFFSATEYKLLGFQEKEGIFYAVVEQSFVKSDELISLDTLEEVMNENGFFKKDPKKENYYNDELGIILEDLHDENVLLQDGIPFFIDTIFYLTEEFYNDSKTNNISKQTTSLSRIYDVNNENRISEVLSQFLTAYVDIAKDPYITKGNYNSYTINTAMLLIRAGAPLEWVTGFIGQPILQDLSNLELNKQSKLAKVNTNPLIQTLNSYTSLLNDLIGTEELLKFEENILKPLSNLGTSVSKSKYTKIDILKKNIKNPDLNNVEFLKSQIVYLTMFREYSKYAKELNDIVTYSKADVNGTPSNIVENFIYNKKTNEILNSPNFINVKKLFDNFLGTKHDNSVKLAEKIFEKEFITVDTLGKTILNYYYALNEKSITLKKDMKKIESSIFSYLISKSKDLSLSTEEIVSLMKTKDNYSNLQKDIEKHLQSDPDNLLLNQMFFNNKDSLGFIEFENLTNKPSYFKNELVNSWRELHLNNPKLSTDLIKYSFLTSNFQFGMNSFFEFIPTEILKPFIKDTLELSKQFDDLYYVDEFFDYYHQNNTNSIVPSNLKVIKGKYHNPKVYKNNIIIAQNTSKPYILIKSEKNKYLYKLITIEKGISPIAYYRRIDILGYENGKYKLYENNTKNTIFTKNKITVSDDLLDEYFNKLEISNDIYEIDESFKNDEEDNGDALKKSLNNKEGSAKKEC